MRSFFVAMLVFGAVFGTFFIAPSAHANIIEQCQCWCAFSGGADKGPVSTIDKPGTCTEHCREKGGRSLGCYIAGAANTPNNNTRCWAQEECTESTATINGREVNGEWGSKQPDECIADERYCYNPALPITLGVPVDGIGEVRGLSEYIQIMYAFLIRVGALIAVVMMMAGGFMWMTSQGGAAIGKAKSMIAKSATGLVLLLSAVAIATLIDPRLNNFEELRVPKVQQAIFLSEDSSCEQIEELAGDNVLEDLTGRDCGDSAIIGEIPDGTQISGGLEKGSECTFRKCPAGGSCVQDRSTGEFACASCEDIHSSQGSLLPPSSSTCSRFSGGDLSGLKHECFYTTSSDVIEGLAGDGFGIGDYVREQVNGGTCVAGVLNCSTVTRCADYESAAGFHAGPRPEDAGERAYRGLQELVEGFIDLVQFNFVTDGLPEQWTPKALCLEDYCNVGGCSYTQSSAGIPNCY